MLRPLRVFVCVWCRAFFHSNDTGLDAICGSQTMSLISRARSHLPHEISSLRLAWYSHITLDPAQFKSTNHAFRSKLQHSGFPNFGAFSQESANQINCVAYGMKTAVKKKKLWIAHFWMVLPFFFFNKVCCEGEKHHTPCLPASKRDQEAFWGTEMCRKTLTLTAHARCFSQMWHCSYSLGERFNQK